MPEIPSVAYWALGALLLLVFVFIVVRAALSIYRVVSPNKALIISGRKGFRVITGGGTFVMPVIEKAEELDLTLQTIDIDVIEVLTANAVPVTVEAVAQIRVGDDDGMLNAAAKMQLGKTASEIREIAKVTLAGHLRSILGTLTVEDLYTNRERFSDEARRQATDDMAGMGLKIVSFNIKEMKDSNGYIKSLGVKQTAAVVRDAAIADAEAKRDTDVKVAAANRAGEQARIEAAAQVAEANRDLQVKQAQFKREADTAQAEAEMAHSLKTTEIEEDLTRRQGAVAVERQKQAALAAQENLRVAELQQQAETVIPAKAAREAAVERAEGEARATERGAEAEAVRVRQTKTAEADGTRAAGEAEAASERAKLLAKAEGERELANALSANEGVNFLLEALRLKMDVDRASQVAHAQALGQLGQKLTVTQIGGSNGNGNLLDTVMAQLVSANAQSEALTGQSLREQLEGFLALLRDKDMFAGAPSVYASDSNGTESAVVVEAAEVAADAQRD